MHIGGGGGICIQFSKRLHRLESETNRRTGMEGRSNLSKVGRYEKAETYR